MEEQVAALLAALKKPSTNVDTRLQLFTPVKSYIKHQRVPEACQADTFECIRIAMTAQTSAQLVTTGFSTLSHLIKRLVVQKETHILTVYAGMLCPVLLEHHGEVIWHGMHGTGSIRTAELAGGGPAAAVRRTGDLVVSDQRREVRAWAGIDRPRYSTEVAGTEVAGAERGPFGRWAVLLRRRRQPARCTNITMNRAISATR